MNDIINDNSHKLISRKIFRMDTHKQLNISRVDVIVAEEVVLANTRVRQVEEPQQLHPCIHVLNDSVSLVSL